jgi:predicted ATPase/class 3 adenylate cyclase
MTELPTGTVTFLFTDVEGSTRLLDEVGPERYGELLGEHRRLLRETFARHGGVEVDTQGDAFFVAFATAPAAVAAARDGQALLARRAIRVRMGLHTGTPALHEGGYVGMDVHRAARIAAAAHGGQVVVSATTAALVTGDGLRDLGEHRFKDLAAPERVWQLGDADFPPLKSLGRTNLPVPATPFLGRDDELVSVAELLMRPEVRLLTLTGPGGTGKTRLALQAAAETAEMFADGITWVPLAPLRDPALTNATVAGALEIPEVPDRPVDQSLREWLGGKRVLLLLDNAEHLLPDVAAEVSGLLAAPGPTVLVTSRERLRVAGEHAFGVPSLSEADARILFVARARQVDESFVETPAVVELCRQLDFLPLALELAAARTSLFSPEQLLERLSTRLDLLKGGRDADPRQATLRATIDWSYELLDEDERDLFAAFAVFVGGCTFGAAEEVAGAEPDTLQSLIDKSLVRRRPEGDRYWMLETIREFAAERLAERDDADERRTRHAAYYASFVGQADPYVRHGPDQQEWVARVAGDYDNIRAAVAFGLEREPELAARLVGNLTFFLWLRGGLVEAAPWVDACVAHAGDLPPALLTRVHECGSAVHLRLGDVETASRHADEAYRVAAAAGDDRGLANALRERGKVAAARRETAAIRPIYTELEEVAHRAGDPWNAAIALNNLGDLALNEGSWRDVVDLCGRSSEIRRSMGDVWGSALARLNVAEAQIALGEVAAGAESARTALADGEAVGATTIVAWALDSVCLVAAAAGRSADAARILGAANALYEQLESSREGTYEKAAMARTEASLREALGARAFEQEFADGGELPREEAVALATAILDAAT